MVPGCGFCYYRRADLRRSQTLRSKIDQHRFGAEKLSMGSCRTRAVTIKPQVVLLVLEFEDTSAIRHCGLFITTDASRTHFRHGDQHKTSLSRVKLGLRLFAQSARSHHW